MLPIYVINLDRRPDRMQSITDGLHRLGLKVSRVPAVDARTVTDEELNERVRLGGSFGGIEFDRGAAACVLSHVRALDTFLSTSDAQAALILEDDAELADDLPMFLESTDWWPADVNLVRIEGWRKKGRLLSRVCAEPYRGRELRRIAVFIAGACGYIIGRDTARYILDKLSQRFFPDGPCTFRRSQFQNRSRSSTDATVARLGLST